MRARVAAVVAAASFVVFGCVAALVQAGATAGLDAAGMMALRAGDGPAWLAETARDVTALGSNGVVLLGVAGLAGYALAAGRRADSAWLVAAVAGALLLVAAVKLGVGRARPAVVPALAPVFTTAFPSSHAAVSAALATACPGFAARGSPAAFVTAAAVVVVGLIGVSRVYLGLHWPSDVVAGWALGLGWGCCCLAVRRGRVGPSRPL